MQKRIATVRVNSADSWRRGNRKICGPILPNLPLGYRDRFRCINIGLEAVSYECFHQPSRLGLLDVCGFSTVVMRVSDDDSRT